MMADRPTVGQDASLLHRMRQVRADALASGEAPHMPFDWVEEIIAALSPNPDAIARLVKAATFLLWQRDRQGPVMESLEAWEAMRNALAALANAKGADHGG